MRLSASQGQQALLQIQADIVKNNICPNLAQEATQLVFGDGNIEADLMFVGEAPGKNEDLQGIPFVGSAGKFLEQMLQSIGLERQDVYITNIVKYRPPGNRDPLPEEKQAFLPYLLRQIEVINPKLLITLGRHSMEHFLPGMKISQVHGRVFRKTIGFSNNSLLGDDTRKSRVTEKAVLEALRQSNAGSDEVAAQEAKQNEGLGSSTGFAAKLVVLPLYHPAAALYNGSMRATLEDDFKKIPKILQKIN